LVTAVREPLTEAVREHYDRMGVARDVWYRRNRHYHRYLESQLLAIIPAGSSVLELGSATGNLLNALRPTRGLGIDLSPAMMRVAAHKFPHLEFRVGNAEALVLDERFDYVVVSDVIGELSDVAAMLERIHDLSHDGTRLVITFHNPALETVIRLAQRMGLALTPARQNWISPLVMSSMLELADFELVSMSAGFLFPFRLPVVDRLVNERLTRVPGLRYLNLLNVAVARPHRPRPAVAPMSCSVVVPCRNEVGNIDAAVERMPEIGAATEIIFVDGSSTDGTQQRIREMIERYRGLKNIRLIPQVPDIADGSAREAPGAMLKLGKGDAVRKGFDAATGDVLIILDADLTVPPEALPAFHNALASGKARFVNGSRLVYPMEDRAMRLANYFGNKFFAILFSWLLGQPVRDTLCGTKALLRSDYELIRAGRAHFGDFDPFGDFDLLFGAARLRLRILEIPVRYRRRLSGVSKVSVLRHGWLLVAMAWVGFWKLKVSR
jgi:glycosyltransferase involved in cell wall biosynthesis/SAM-dependent methyltransferase